MNQEHEQVVELLKGEELKQCNGGYVSTTTIKIDPPILPYPYPDPDEKGRL